MSTLEELLEGLVSEGTRDSTGSFTLAPSQVWGRLSQSLTGPEDLPRFAVRWLANRPERPLSIRIEDRSGNVTFVASELSNRVEERPEFDYSGRDLDLARAMVAVQQLEIPSVSVNADGWVGTAKEANPVAWERQREEPTGEITLTLSLPRKLAKTLIGEWKLLLQQTLAYCPIPIAWNKTPITRSVEFSLPSLVWRRLIPTQKTFPLLDFCPPSSAIEHYVTPRHDSYEVLISLGPGTASQVSIIHRGDIFALHRPGFLPGFEIIINSPEISLDMNGQAVVVNQKLEQLLESIRPETYDMVLELYRTDRRLTNVEMAGMMTPLSSILLYLLSQKRVVEGYLIAQWIQDSLGDTIPPRSRSELYTFYRAASILAEKAEHPLTARRFSQRADELWNDKAHNHQSAVEAALIDAHLDSRIRANEPDRISHHIRSQLHLLGVRSRSIGAKDQAFTIFSTLLKNYDYLEDEQLELWFDTAELCKELGRMDSLKWLLRLIKRSTKHGHLNLTPKVRGEVNTFADLVTKKKREP